MNCNYIRPGGVAADLPDGWQQRIRPFLANYRAHGLDCEWLDVGDVSGFGVSHDRRWIRIYQHDLVTFLTQRFARLRPGIVKLASLTNNNWTRADD
jgi:hypothetical protein